MVIAATQLAGAGSERRRQWVAMCGFTLILIAFASLVAATPVDGDR